MSDLRIRTYEILGLEVGSLANEGGRDWNEALAEAKAELKQKETYIQFDDLLDKEKIINSCKFSDYPKKVKIIQKYILTDNEIAKILKCNDKEVILEVLRTQNIKKEILSHYAENGTYLVKKLANDLLNESNNK